MNEITAKGLEDLKKELDYLKNVKIREIAELIRHTASFGDLKENAAYHDAKDKQAFLQGKISELEQRIRNSEVVKNNNSGRIQVGSKVLLSLNGEEESVELVGPGQADPLKGKISYESPLGKAILNKIVGDEIKTQLGENVVECKILKIQ
jgi:transcription elongation factor GreA